MLQGALSASRQETPPRVFFWLQAGAAWVLHRPQEVDHVEKVLLGTRDYQGKMKMETGEAW